MACVMPPDASQRPQDSELQNKLDRKRARGTEALWSRFGRPAARRMPLCSRPAEGSTNGPAVFS